MDMFMNELKYINAMHYPTNNCDGSKVPQDEYPAYLSHASATEFVAPYILPVGESSYASNTSIVANSAYSSRYCRRQAVHYVGDKHGILWCKLFGI